MGTRERKMKLREGIMVVSLAQCGRQAGTCLSGGRKSLRLVCGVCLIAVIIICL
jgi:hypothetical protein